MSVAKNPLRSHATFVQSLVDGSRLLAGAVESRVLQRAFNGRQDFVRENRRVVDSLLHFSSFS
jgi:hypothetical protein